MGGTVTFSIPMSKPSFYQACETVPLTVCSAIVGLATRQEGDTANVSKVDGLNQSNQLYRRVKIEMDGV